MEGRCRRDFHFFFIYPRLLIIFNAYFLISLFIRVFFHVSGCSGVSRVPGLSPPRNTKHFFKNNYKFVHYFVRCIVVSYPVL